MVASSRADGLGLERLRKLDQHTGNGAFQRNEPGCCSALQKIESAGHTECSG